MPLGLEMAQKRLCTMELSYCLVVRMYVRLQLVTRDRAVALTGQFDEKWSPRHFIPIMYMTIYFKFRERIWAMIIPFKPKTYLRECIRFLLSFIIQRTLFMGLIIIKLY